MNIACDLASDSEALALACELASGSLMILVQWAMRSFGDRMVSGLPAVLACIADITLALSDIWLSKINAKVMPVTHSYLFSQIELENTIGYAVNGKHNGPSHPEWTHSFSKFYKQLKGPTNRWTYDTTDK